MRPTRWVTTIAALAAAGTLAACGSSTPAAAPPPTSGPPASPSPGTGPSASPDPAGHADIRTMVEAAKLNPRQLGVAKPASEQTTFSLTVPCRMSLKADYVATHYWSYKNAKIDVVSHSVFGFDPQRGTDVIDQIEQTLTWCKTWIYGDSLRMKLAGPMALSRPKGIDGSLAYCHQGTVLTGKTKGDVAFLCDGLVSRGRLVASVSTVELTLAGAQRELKKAVPLAAAALVKAVPRA